jgi:hypothetical protein
MQFNSSRVQTHIHYQQARLNRVRRPPASSRRLWGAVGAAGGGGGGGGWRGGGRVGLGYVSAVDGARAAAAAPEAAAAEDAPAQHESRYAAQI